MSLSFVRGMVAAVNPCGFILLPTYLMYFLGLQGAMPGTQRATMRRAVIVSAAVSAGFLSVFLVAGVISYNFTSWINENAKYATGAIGLAALLPVGAALANAGYQLSTRLLARADPPLTTLVYTALVGALLSSMALPFAWVTPTPLEWGKLMATGLLGAVSHFALIKAFSLANAAVVAPFTYTSLLWATLLGFLLFGDFPDLWTVAGAALIVGSGLYILYREGVKRRERERAERGAERGSAPAPKTGLR